MNIELDLYPDMIALSTIFYMSLNERRKFKMPIASSITWPLFIMELDDV